MSRSGLIVAAPIERRICRIDPLIDRLVHELKPVRHRTAWGDALALAVLCVLETGLFLALGMTRPDMPAAMHLPSFWWKLTSMGLIASASGAGNVRLRNFFG